ncbi:transmembrane protein 79-like isoform X2 [Takifugu flavidus]|uniref:Transmembrane protein 79 n=2 Tax=Takifugu flavidus TaxID=433684 RepID=A0A5C6PMC8_9TELE|nr:transmembrane protein 79-like isoform X2 [Takifugu flavidus]TWW79868.1 Transmembrane protein 79 [Takifugu flavidus]
MGDDGTESSTLRWPGDLRTNVATDRLASVETDKDDRTSVQSDVISCTESEREPIVKSERRGGGAREQAETGVGTDQDSKEEEPLENQLPEKAAQVFAPALTIPHSSPALTRESQELWEMESQKSPLLVPQGTPYHENQFNWEEDTNPSTFGCRCPPREVLKVGVSLMSAAMFFPFLVWGGYVFLPFDAPLLDGAPLRLVYTLRCSVFSVTPIILGWLVLGACRLKYGVIRPLFDDVVENAGTQEVSIHRRFLSDSSSLFLIYFLQLVILAMYLSQEQLKLVPLLTIIFALGRVVYWVAAAFGSSVRGFGFGLSFLPSIAMMVANFYFVFTVEATGSIFSHLSPLESLNPPDGKQRFWG